MDYRQLPDCLQMADLCFFVIHDNDTLHVDLLQMNKWHFRVCQFSSQRQFCLNPMFEYLISSKVSKTIDLLRKRNNLSPSFFFNCNVNQNVLVFLLSTLTFSTPFFSDFEQVNANWEMSIPVQRMLLRHKRRKPIFAFCVRYSFSVNLVIKCYGIDCNRVHKDISFNNDCDSFWVLIFSQVIHMEGCEELH